MSQCSQLKIIICVKIFFTLFNTIVSRNPIFGKPYLEDNEAFHETVDESDFFSNVHTLMTPQELYHTFGTENGPVPDYKVFPMNLRPSRKKREINDRIKLNLEIDNQIINLNLIPTDGHLATKNTPVWLAHTDSTAYNRIRYNPYPSAMRYILKFRMYHDLKNEAAITVFTDPEHNETIEGIITSKYTIRTLPQRFTSQVIKERSKFFALSPILSKRSIKTDEDEITGHFVLFKIQYDVVHKPLIIPKFKSREKRQSPIGNTRNTPDTVYPEILLVLDYDVVRKRSITQALIFVLAFWNGVDMVYSSINEPKICLHIAGIIISLDDEATPYIASDTSVKVIAHATNIPERMGWYFYDEKGRFPMTQYDIIFAMTAIKLCDNETEPCTESLGYAYSGAACVRKHHVEMFGTIGNLGIIHYNTMFGGVNTAAHEIAHLFDVPHDTNVGLSTKCFNCVMARADSLSQNNFKWSSKSKASFRRYFSLKISQCLDNKPVTMNVTERVLPGQWMTLDGQCRNHGFYESCNLPGVSSCMYHACKAEESDKCIKRNFLLLPGSRCDENKALR